MLRLQEHLVVHDLRDKRPLFVQHWYLLANYTHDVVIDLGVIAICHLLFIFAEYPGLFVVQNVMVAFVSIFVIPAVFAPGGLGLLIGFFLTIRIVIVVKFLLLEYRLVGYPTDRGASNFAVVG